MFRRTVLIAAFMAMAGLAAAQIHGVPAGATSLGGGHTMFNPPGIPASATSLGPRGFSAPRTFGTRPPFGPVERDGRHDGQHARRVIIPVAVPLYSYGAYPYLYPYSSYEPVPAEMTPSEYRDEA